MDNQGNIHTDTAPFLCRACLWLDPVAPLKDQTAPHCPKCNSHRTLQHPELLSLSIAHMDCDAFYACVEKRDNPALKNKPLIIGGGGNRGVVSTACYIARLYGIHSAQPMYKARQLCPDAVILPPKISKYRSASQQIRTFMDALTPLVEPLSLDEAFLDLSGTETLHGAPPVLSLVKLAHDIETHVGVTVSVGLASNKFLAKLASDMDKPRGFTVIGESDKCAVLAPMAISKIMGIGRRSSHILEKDGLTHIYQLQQMAHSALVKRYGETGDRLYRLSRGIDTRSINPERPTKSISSETTFEKNIHEYERLEKVLWQQCEKVSFDAKRKKLAGKTITLKLKNSNHRSITRSRSRETPTQMATSLFDIGRELLAELCDGTPYRLLGIGISNFRPLLEADQPDLIDTRHKKRTDAEIALDKIRAKFGKDSVRTGRTLTPGKTK